MNQEVFSVDFDVKRVKIDNELYVNVQDLIDVYTYVRDNKTNINKQECDNVIDTLKGIVEMTRRHPGVVPLFIADTFPLPPAPAPKTKFIKNLIK